MAIYSKHMYRLNQGQYLGPDGKLGLSCAYKFICNDIETIVNTQQP